MATYRIVASRSGRSGGATKTWANRPRAISERRDGRTFGGPSVIRPVEPSGANRRAPQSDSPQSESQEGGLGLRSACLARTAFLTLKARHMGQAAPVPLSCRQGEQRSPLNTPSSSCVVEGTRLSSCIWPSVRLFHDGNDRTEGHDRQTWGRIPDTRAGVCCATGAALQLLRLDRIFRTRVNAKDRLRVGRQPFPTDLRRPMSREGRRRDSRFTSL